MWPFKIKTKEPSKTRTVDLEKLNVTLMVLNEKSTYKFVIYGSQCNDGLFNTATTEFHAWLLKSQQYGFIVLNIVNDEPIPVECIPLRRIKKITYTKEKFLQEIPA
jgi:hypothetical protein